MTAKTEAGLAKQVASADEPLRIVGGGTRSQASAAEGDVLSVAGLAGVTLYEPGALTLVAKAGTSVAEIDELLLGERQRLAFEPMDHRLLLGTEGKPTIGGVVAANVSGPRRMAVGACRDFLLGVRFVDGTGRILKNGGRVMKNVTGYDLVKLMAGSRGTLGVLTEVSLKVLPAPETVVTLVWRGASSKETSKLFSQAISSPFEVTGAAGLPDEGEGAATMIRLEGFADSVAYRIGRLIEALGGTGPDQVITKATENDVLWKKVRDVESFAKRDGNVWKTSVKPTDMVQVVEKLDHDHVIDWGGGLIWTMAPADVDLRRELAGIGGHSTLIRGSGFPAFEPEATAVAALSAGLRQKFDPKGILNPGLMA